MAGLGADEDLEEFELFTALEFLHDHASDPRKFWMHSYGGCGLHASDGDDDAGRAEVRSRINPLLAQYSDGYEMSEAGEVLRIAPFGQNVEPEKLGHRAVDDRIALAISTFRRHGSGEAAQRQAIRELADALEFLREGVGTQLFRNDENRLFEIANEYGIRHLNSNQRTDYDPTIWLNWYFYTCLNAIDLAIKLRKRTAQDELPSVPSA